ncbi:MAG: YwaF family protein [Oscillospiraceae bacterium]|nr:YwaF family protein [Oscillospiraceae bacterium]
MSEFWYTRETMKELFPDYINFPHFGPKHLAVVAVMLAIIVAGCLVYRKLSDKDRGIFLKVMAVLLIIDELWKYASTIFTGQWLWGFLPLHLCSINIFVCVYNSIKRDDFSSEVLYALCVPGAALAIFMPTWNNLPLLNSMSLHSNTVHLLLEMYPLLLLSGGFKPSIKRLPKVFLLLLCECVPIFFINKVLDTNFFFLNGTDNNPVLEILVGIFGENLYFLGMPFLLVVVWAVMYLPWYLIEKKKQKISA